MAMVETDSIERVFLRISEPKCHLKKFIWYRKVEEESLSINSADMSHLTRWVAQSGRPSIVTMLCIIRV